MLRIVGNKSSIHQVTYTTNNVYNGYVMTSIIVHGLHELV